MTATGVGSYPGEDDRDYAETVRIVLGELAPPDGLPHLPELPGRGAGATMTGRALALVALSADLQPAGWRLTGSSATSGVDHRRARSQHAQDLDQVEDQGQDLVGAFKVQVAGPWTLAATVEKPRGDKILSDHGARRELAEALAEGVAEHVADVRRRLPGVERLVVQLDEPALASVLRAEVPTASGFGRHRSVDLPEASGSLGLVLGAVSAAGAEPWVHTCAARTPLDLLRGAGARGLAVDEAQLLPGDLDEIAVALEAGEWVALGVVPSLDPGTPPEAARVTGRVLGLLEMLGLDPGVVGGQVVLTPACGLAGASPAWVRQALEICRTAARDLVR
ncbi:methionine synthase [Nocardioides bigeumensis]|uniref:Methionine synthase n=1 Tax=Nocardioides bigeumensis TaxID=433657 RepID=A0ABN2XPV7_9ACTN